MRPLPETPAGGLAGKPVLVLAARRSADPGCTITGAGALLEETGARVSLEILPAGHGLTAIGSRHHPALPCRSCTRRLEHHSVRWIPADGKMMRRTMTWSARPDSVRSERAPIACSAADDAAAFRCRAAHGRGKRRIAEIDTRTLQDRAGIIDDQPQTAIPVEETEPPAPGILACAALRERGDGAVSQPAMTTSGVISKASASVPASTQRSSPSMLIFRPLILCSFHLVHLPDSMRQGRPAGET